MGRPLVALVLTCPPYPFIYGWKDIYTGIDNIFVANIVREHACCACEGRRVATKLGIVLSFFFFFFLSFFLSFHVLGIIHLFLFPRTYFSPRLDLPRKLKFGGSPNLTLTRRFAQKRWGKGPPPKKLFQKIIFSQIQFRQPKS